MEQTWQELLRSGRRLTDGVLYRVLGFSQSAERLRISLGRTSYREYLCTNVAHPEWRQEYGPECMSDAVAVTGVAVTQDGQVPVQRRSALVGEWPGAYAVAPSGHPQPPNTIQEALMEELVEETGARHDEVEGEPRLTGLVLETARHKTEVTFLLRLALTWAQLKERVPADAWEYQSLEPLTWTPGACAEFLLSHEEETIPQSHGGLLLAGRVQFGQRWYEQTVSQLLETDAQGWVGG
ncbi:MAG: NUDIX domain-containing protein [Chloroflexota bacterium]|nr:NUDIX domain-containing protein [Chloroflexota bacterium]